MYGEEGMTYIDITNLIHSKFRSKNTNRTLLNL